MAEPTLKKGSKGQAVKDLQEALKALKYKPGPSTASSARRPRTR